MEKIKTILTTARSLAMDYPAIVPEVQTINDAMQSIQMKVMQVQPPTEVAAPPQ